MTRVNTNVSAQVTLQALARNDRTMSTAMERLSTGLRVNSAKDDAAGLQIGSRMKAQINGLRQAVVNAQDAISMLQTSERMVADVHSIMLRVRELGIQGLNGTLGAEDRAAIHTEMSQLVAEAWRIGDNTQFNGLNVGNGSIGDAAGHVKYQIGANAGQTISVNYNQYWDLLGLSSFPDVPTMIAYSRANPFDFNTQAGTEAGLLYTDTYLDVLSTVRTTVGSTINRMNHAIDTLSQTLVNTQAARSRILDADYALQTAVLARTQILIQAGVAMLTQANQRPSDVLELLGT